jgi:predicted O-linked N-acetylglucosamine transferase (SPINDLY family)
MPPQNPFAQGLALHQRGQLREAEALYRQALADAPEDFGALNMLGVLKAQTGAAAEGLLWLERALALQPGHAGALVNYANVLSLLGRGKDAVAAYDRALATRPDAESFVNRGFALQSLNRPAEALASFEQALALEPRNIQALYRRGVTLNELGRSDEALAAYDRVLAMESGHIEALNNRGYIWWLNKKQWAPAIADLEKALMLGPDLPYGQGAVLHLKMYAADWDDFEQRKTDIVQGLRRGGRVARPFMFQAVSGDPRDLQACARIYTRDLHPELPSPPHDPAARRGRTKIRLGYLSGEFRNQATAILMAGLYERHDRSRFDVIAVDNGSADVSAMTARLKQAFDGWLDIGDLTDEEAAEKIRAAEIDILVNLNGYFGKHRMGVFARRPAPVHVNYLGFPGTLGATYMDYILADDVVIPPGEERFYDEKVVRLAGSYQVNDDRGRTVAAIPSRMGAGLPPKGFVFCNFNQAYKLTPETFAGWMRILTRVDGSVLWLLEEVAPFAENIARHARAQGVAPERILFAPHLPPAQHLARLSLADLFLDGLPYNAHTTASDALWSGVPVLTQAGMAFPGRVAASLLRAAGLADLITANTDDFERQAVTLATDPAALATVKKRLTRDSPLFDTDLFRHRVEAAYQKMWQTWLAGKTAEGFGPITSAREE